MAEKATLSTQSGEVAQTRESDRGSAGRDIKHRLWNLRLVKTVAIYLSFVGMGMSTGGYGPAVVNLEMLLVTDLKTLGTFMIAGSVGYLFGSISGGILVDRFNQELLFASASLLQAVAFSLFPWAGNVYNFGVLQFVRGASLGVLDAGGQAYLLRHWYGTKHMEPLFQALHALWSVGAAVGPFIIKPFLVPLSVQTEGCSILNSLTTTDIATEGDPESLCNVSSTANPPAVARVRYGFAIIAAVDLVAAVMFYAIFFIQGPFCLTRNRKHKNAENARNKRKKEDNRHRLILLSMMFLFFALYLWVEDLPGVYLSTMAVKGLGWDVRVASMVSSVYWGCHCIGRLLSVPLSSCFTPRQMLVTGMVLTTLSFLVMSICASMFDPVMWFTTGLAGLGMSSVFASCVLWASRYIWVSGVAAGVFVVGSSVGVTTGSPLAGYLSQTYTYMWIAYLPFLASVGDIILFAAMQAFVSLFPRRHPEGEEGEEGEGEVMQEELQALKAKDGERPM